MASQSTLAAETAATDVARAIDRLRLRVVCARPTFHAFERRGRRFLYDLWSGAVLELDAPAFAVIRGVEDGRDAHEIARQLGRLGVARGEVEAVVSEIERLASAGLFQLEALENAAEREETLCAHIDHAPNKLMLLVQTACNLKCTYCYEMQSGFHRDGKAMSLDTAVRAIAFLIERSGARPALEITFFGGEPLLDLHLVRRIVEHCERRGADVGKRFHFQVTTNATLLDDAAIEFLVAKRFGVMISIDGPPERADVNRVDHAGNGATKRALGNARKLIAAQKAAGVRPAVVRATMAPGNASARAIAEFFEGEGFERQMIGASFGRAHARGPRDLGAGDLPALAAECEETFDRYLAWLDGRGPRPAGAAIEEQLARLDEALAAPRRRAGVGCGVGRNMLAIAADGSMTPCHRYAGESSYRIGDLDRGIDAARVESYYREILAGYDEHCSRCWARLICGGQCPWYLSQPDGRVGLPDEASCDAIRRGIERQIWLREEVRRRRVDSAAPRGEEVTP